MRSLFFILVVSIFPTISFAEESFDVSTIDGSRVRVSSSEIARAYRQTLQAELIARRIVGKIQFNTDGSVVLSQLRFGYSNELWKLSYIHDNTAQTLCRILDQGQVTGKKRGFEQKYGRYYLVLDSDATYGGKVWDKHYLAQVTCSGR